MTTLFDAIEQGDLKALRRLMRLGASLEQIDEDSGVAPLALAAECGRLNIVRILIRAGVDPDWGGATTPLESAALEGHLDIAAALIASRADVNRPVSDGFTPLITAASTGNLEMVRMLLEAGANPRVIDDEGESAITVAQNKDNNDVVEMLEAALANGNGLKIPRSIFEAIENRDLEKLKEYLEKADMENGLASTGREGLTPLGCAAKMGHVVLVRALLEAGADIEVGGHRTPLYSAAENRHDPVVSLLLEEGAKVNTPCGDDLRTPLMAAAASGHIETVRLLLEAGADAKILDKNKRDSLWHAASTGKEQNFTFLLPHIKVADRKAATSELASHVETRRKLATSAALMIDHIHAGKLDLAKQMLADGLIDPDGFDEEGKTALMLAARLGRRDLMRMLIAAGASFELRCDVDGYTALIHAIWSDVKNANLTVSLLAAAGADLNNPSADGRTPLMHVTDRYLDLEEEDIEMFSSLAEPLLHTGADIERCDAKGSTAWERVYNKALGENVSAGERRKLSRVLRFLERSGALRSDGPSADMMTAVAEGQLGRVEDLFSELSGVSDVEGMPLLAVAAANDHWDVVSFLVSAGLDINSTNQYGDTILMQASAKGTLPIVEHLIQAGADPKIKNRDGKTAVALAQAAGHQAVADLLKG